MNIFSMKLIIGFSDYFFENQRDLNLFVFFLENHFFVSMSSGIWLILIVVFIISKNKLFFWLSIKIFEKWPWDKTTLTLQLSSNYCESIFVESFKVNKINAGILYLPFIHRLSITLLFRLSVHL